MEQSKGGNTHELTLTKPKSPGLLTKYRKRPTYILSQKEKDEQEAKEMERFKNFKATPFNPKIFTHTRGVPFVRSKPTTRTKEVHLKTETRAKTWKKPEEPEEFVFKANPAPKNILAPRDVNVPSPLRSVLKRASTVPVPFKFENRNKQQENEPNSNS